MSLLAQVLFSASISNFMGGRTQNFSSVASIIPKMASMLETKYLCKGRSSTGSLSLNHECSISNWGHLKESCWSDSAIGTTPWQQIKQKQEVLGGPLLYHCLLFLEKLLRKAFCKQSIIKQTNSIILSRQTRAWSAFHEGMPCTGTTAVFHGYQWCLWELCCLFSSQHRQRILYR